MPRPEGSRRNRWCWAALLAMMTMTAWAASPPTALARSPKRGERSGDRSTDRPARSSARQNRQCVDAYAAAAKLERAARLRDAKAMMLVCAQPACGGARHGFLRRECLFRFDRLAADIPSVVPLVTDGAGDPVADVQVLMDGQFLTARTDGIAVPIDPGVHEFTFKRAGVVVGTQQVAVVQGQQNRPVTVALEKLKKPEPTPAAAAKTDPASEAPRALAKLDPKTDQTAEQKTDDEDDQANEDETIDEAPSRTRRPAEERGRHLSFGSVALGTIALAGGGGFALLTTWGRKDNLQLSQCTPHCPQSGVDRINKLYRAANISGAIGAAALVGAVIVYAASGPSADEEADDGRASLRFGVALQPTSAAALLSGRF